VTLCYLGAKTARNTGQRKISVKERRVKTFNHMKQKHLWQLAI
jgi:hypothetical protein